METTPMVNPFSIKLEERDKIIDIVARKIIDYGLETPAIFLLETGKPLSFFGSQGIIMAGVFVTPFFGEDKVNKLSAFFDDRNNIELLIQRIEEISGLK